MPLFCWRFFCGTLAQQIPACARHLQPVGCKYCATDKGGSNLRYLCLHTLFVFLYLYVQELVARLAAGDEFLPDVAAGGSPAKLVRLVEKDAGLALKALKAFVKDLSS